MEIFQDEQKDIGSYIIKEGYRILNQFEQLQKSKEELTKDKSLNILFIITTLINSVLSLHIQKKKKKKKKKNK